MRIIDGLNLPGHKVEIPDCSRYDLPEFFKDMGFRCGAEIGVRRGLFTEHLAKGGQQVYAVDPWEEYGDYRESHAMKMEECYLETCRRLAKLPVVIIRKRSMDALSDIRDKSLDWVYIDGNHSLPYVIQDIFYWSQKVRAGGVVCGDDYRVIKFADPFRYNVVPAVDCYVRTADIAKWYILGRKEVIPGEKRDKFRNWMWVNP